MGFLSAREKGLLQAVSTLSYCNPFLPEWLEAERAALGAEFVEGQPVWSYRYDRPQPRENVWRLQRKLEPVVEDLRARLHGGANAAVAELALYEDTVLYLLYTRYYPAFFEASFGPDARKPSPLRWRFYNNFLADWRHLFAIDGVEFPTGHDARHTFACFRQIQRAFEHVFQDIIGSSMPAARLRAAVWQSVFTHDMRRYRRTLYARMAEFVTLITGPSGTGKELAARAIAESRYVPFDDQKLTFAHDGAQSFFPINISALSPTLVESELFGHRRGSFTGALGDRQGWLETCPEAGSVFVDELGDLDTSIQVKLLRVIETRTFHPVGDTSSKQFRGKLIAATNRNLADAMRQGKFREDLYYRLCSDQITTPSLAEQLADSPDVLHELVIYMSRRVAGQEADELGAEVLAWIENNLGKTYAWPGNYRELEQCVKNVLIRKDYRPSRSNDGDAVSELLEGARAGAFSVEELLTRYITLVYGRVGTYEEAARRLGLDRRTVKAKVDGGMLGRLKG